MAATDRSLTSPFIPLTRVQLKNIITLRTYPRGKFVSDPATFAAEVFENAKGLTLIGSAETLVERQVREGNNVYRELNANPIDGTFGLPVESYPGLISYSLTLRKVVLYDENILEAFDLAGSDLVAQKAPLIIYLTREVPIDPVTNAALVVKPGIFLKAESRIYFGCWLDKNETEFSVTDNNLKVIQETTMIASRVSSSKYRSAL